MDESQIDKLGSKMRDVYDDVASEAPVPTAGASKRPSHRLRKSRTFGRASRPKPAAASRGAVGDLIAQYPVASLLIAAGVAYVLARR